MANLIDIIIKKVIFPTSTYNVGERIYEQGTVADGMFIIQSGRVEIMKEDADNTLSLGYRGEGEFIGEIGILEGKRSASVIAAEPTEIFHITTKQFWRALDNDEEFRRALVETFINRLLEADEKRLDLNANVSKRSKSKQAMSSITKEQLQNLQTTVAILADLGDRTDGSTQQALSDLSTSLSKLIDAIR